MKKQGKINSEITKAREKIKSMQSDIETLNGRLDLLKNDSIFICPEDREKVKSETLSLIEGYISRYDKEKFIEDFGEFGIGVHEKTIGEEGIDIDTMIKCMPARQQEEPEKEQESIVETEPKTVTEKEDFEI